MSITPPPDWVMARRRTIGARIRSARLHANLSQVALANLVGVDHRTIHRIEYAASDPSLSLLLLLADALEIPLADLIRE